jgi:hypothetical protein
MILAITSMMFFGCTSEEIGSDNLSAFDANDDCIGVNPQVRITNNGDVNFDLDVYGDQGLLGFVHNIAPGETSTWITFTEGETLFAVSNDTYKDEKVIYHMMTCMEFNMEIGVDNQLTSAIPVDID